MKSDRLEKDSNELLILRREAGKWLRERRDEVRMTQRQLADAVGIEYYTFISQIEAGRGRVPPDRYEIYAQALKIDPRDFAVTMLRYNEPHIYNLIFESSSPTNVSAVADLEARLRRVEAAIRKG